MKSYSVWLEPAVDANSESLRSANEHLCSLIGGPRFSPHITLLGNAGTDEAQGKRLIEALSFASPPFSVELNEIGFNEVWNQASYVRAFNDILFELRAAADGLLGHAKEPYMPNVSLCYGTMPEDVRRKAVDELGLTLPITLTLDRLSLWDTTNDDTEKNVPNWTQVVAVPLRGESQAISRNMA